MTRWILGLALVGAIGCGKSVKNDLNVAYTVQGTVTLVLPSGAVPESALGGSIDVVLFNTNSPGYCLAGPSAFAGAALNLVINPKLSDLETVGVPYSFAVSAAPGQTYPVTVYPSALLQQTQQIFHSCEATAAGDKYNAEGFYGIAPSQYASLPAANTSPCCAAVANPVTISAAGEVVSGIDIVLVPLAAPPGGCPAPTATFDACVYRHASTGQDSVCWTALGADAPALIKKSDGSMCN